MESESLNLVILNVDKLPWDKRPDVANWLSRRGAVGFGNDAYLVPGDYGDVTLFLYRHSGRQPASGVRVYSLSAFARVDSGFERQVKQLCVSHLRQEFARAGVPYPESDATPPGL